MTMRRAMIIRNVRLQSKSNIINGRQMIGCTWWKSVGGHKSWKNSVALHFHGKIQDHHQTQLKRGKWWKTQSGGNLIRNWEKGGLFGQVQSNPLSQSQQLANGISQVCDFLTQIILSRRYKNLKTWLRPNSFIFFFNTNSCSIIGIDTFSSMVVVSHLDKIWAKNRVTNPK